MTPEQHSRERGLHASVGAPGRAAQRLVGLHARIAAEVARGDDGWWLANRDEMALELCDAQRAGIPGYDSWCRHELATRASRGGPRSSEVTCLAEVPAIPIAAFRQLHVGAIDLADAACWQSSGTTGTVHSRHHVHDLAAYDAAIDVGVARALLPDVVAGSRQPLHCVQLQPSRDDSPASSLSHMFDRIRLGPLCRDAGAWVDARYRVDTAGAWRALEACSLADEPALVLATSFALAMLLDATDERPPLVLPPGSRVVDTGGFKGRTRELTRAELVARTSERLGVGSTWCENEYGMSELSSQAWLGTVAAACDRPLGGAAAMSANARWVPPWLVVRVVDPVTLGEVADGEQGLLVFHDLANAWSCAAVRSEDVGTRRGESFELLGRAEGALLKGCSLRLDQVTGHED